MSNIIVMIQYNSLLSITYNYYLLSIKVLIVGAVQNVCITFECSRLWVNPKSSFTRVLGNNLWSLRSALRCVTASERLGADHVTDWKYREIKFHGPVDAFSIETYMSWTWHFWPGRFHPVDARVAQLLQTPNTARAQCQNRAGLVPGGGCQRPAKGVP
jgi:hypothetical protein